MINIIALEESVIKLKVYIDSFEGAFFPPSSLEDMLRELGRGRERGRKRKRKKERQTQREIACLQYASQLGIKLETHVCALTSNQQPFCVGRTLNPLSYSCWA